VARMTPESKPTKGDSNWGWGMGITSPYIPLRGIGIVSPYLPIGLLKQAKEAAKESDDHDLKDKLSEVYDSFLDLKELIGNLRDENNELRKQLEARANVKWDGSKKLYFAEGDPDPFCPACLDNSGKQIRLHYERGMTGAVIGLRCRVCGNSYHDR